MCILVIVCTLAFGRRISEEKYALMQMARCPSIQISTMYGYKRQLLWGTVTTVCVSVTLIDYLWKSNHPFITRSSDSEGVPATGTNDYQIPTLVQLNASYYCKCDCTGNHDIPEVTATENISCKPTDDAPCQPDGLVLMSMLQKSVNFEQYQGLRYLDHLSLSRYYSCKPSSVPLLPNHTVEKQCKNVTFVNHQSSLVALVSFHGSGNTWVRHLVEQATGIFTGSIYCDPGLKSVFPGESIVSGNVIVIKTHRSDSVELPDDVKLFTQKTSYDKAIVIVRNPYDALVSEANRRWNSKHSINNHLGVADKTTFISTCQNFFNFFYIM